MTSLIAAIALVLMPLAALADPVRYLLEPDRSTVGFTYSFGDGSDDGTMPVLGADLLVDLDTPSRSQVDVTVNVRGARTGFFLATEALRSAQVLDAATYPTIRFRSTRVTPEGTGARIDGELTIRGITLPATLMAQFYRQQGTVAGDRNRLSIYLTGSVSRSAFGASGFAAEVGDRVDLRILARIRREGT
ncbi:YceI family protein [Rhodophyticola porphyridii]|uniref:Polyisoprenoid-binding protein n=1 Tax=Rhodophyticola porphyridii TaxID=1852017 RepID=A0A3L9YJQ8_9RHOB|nr:YceI family protein [Rhodophyticola porphyridii]RMA43030.1 polyisoprenoid-binding protein [Rhodophyticola porphyridii]